MTEKPVKRIVLSTSRTTLRTECVVPGTSESVNEKHIRERIKDSRALSIIDERGGRNVTMYSKKTEEDTDTDTIEYEITEDSVSLDTRHYLMNTLSEFEHHKIEPGSLKPALTGDKPLKAIAFTETEESKLRDKLKTLPDTSAKRYFIQILNEFVNNNIKQEGCIQIGKEMFHFEFLNDIHWRSVLVR